MKLAPRQRIRTLVKLTRLTEAHTLNELGDPYAAAHVKMLGLIGELTMPAPTRDKDAIQPESGGSASQSNRPR
jgi:hypothetical protein